MRMWDRLFFPNERRLRNFVKAGAIDPGAPNARLIGLPKADALVDGTWTREAVLAELRMDPSRPTVLYAPTWSPASSLNAMGIDLVRALLDRDLNVIVKLHDRSRDLRPRYSGGVDWVARLRPVLAGRTGVIAPAHDISPYLVEASDVVITKRTRPICDAPEIVFGSMPNDGGHLLLTTEEKRSLVAMEPGAAIFIRRFGRLVPLVKAALACRPSPMH